MVSSARYIPVVHDVLVGTPRGSNVYGFLPVGRTSVLPRLMSPEGPAGVYPPSNAWMNAPSSSDSSTSAASLTIWSSVSLPSPEGVPFRTPSIKESDPSYSSL